MLALNLSLRRLQISSLLCFYGRLKGEAKIVDGNFTPPVAIRPFLPISCLAIGRKIKLGLLEHSAKRAWSMLIPGKKASTTSFDDSVT